MIESSLMINYGLQKREKENHFLQLKLTNKEENLVLDILTFGRFCHGHKDLLTTDMCKSYQKYIKLTISASYFFSSPLDMVGVCSNSCILCNKKNLEKRIWKKFRHYLHELEDLNTIRLGLES